MSPQEQFLIDKLAGKIPPYLDVLRKRWAVGAGSGSSLRVYAQRSSPGLRE